ncbi:MAG: uroporphyrinogen decarboxylase family protein [Oscillospiraceae bacterium]|nr:uroporphyrinogen decarboxylase family protein [Oscillospiraceae bacterium]
MNSRERVINAINHIQPDQVPVDLGATSQTGINASALCRLRKYYGLPEKPIEIYEMLQMLGFVDEDLRKIVRADVIGLELPYDSLGIDRTNVARKHFTMGDGTEVLFAQGNAWYEDASGATYLYPQGDTSVQPSAVMPASGYFFDNIDRAEPIDEDHLTPRQDFETLFSVINDDTAKYLEKNAAKLFDETEYAIIGNLGGGGLADPGIFPGPAEKKPKGIRRFDEWLLAHYLYPDYIKEVFEFQTEVMIKNLEIYKQAVGDRIQIVWISGTDFGTQSGAMMNLDMFREFYKPYYTRMNQWVHQNTGWKTFYHCCGSIVDFLDDFVDMGMDILNPLQLSAKGMDAAMIKRKYGRKLVFWGGGIDTQNTLPNGSRDEIMNQVTERMEILSEGGGYVFGAIHNIMGNVRPENIASMFEAAHRCNEKFAEKNNM